MILNHEQEISEVQFEEYAFRMNATDFASRSKAKGKPRRRESASSSTRTILVGQELGPMLNQDNIQPPIMKCRRNWFFFVMEVYLERQWWSDWILEKKRQPSETFLLLSTLVWRKVEEDHSKRRRPQEKMPVLYWFFANNIVSRSFRTQSYWS